jgi:hypothetical protein
MDVPFTERHEESIIGILSCYDRVVVQGTLPDICHPQAMTNFFYLHGIRIFDFKKWASPYRDQIREHAEALAVHHGISIEFINKIDSFRKEDRIKEILKQRGLHTGLVHIFSAMETCTAFKPWHDKTSQKTFFKYDSGRCLHYYFYFIDDVFGLCYLRVPTWAPFRLQFYCNGHNYLAIQLAKKNIRFQQIENAFIYIDDFKKAQELANTFTPRLLHKTLDRAVRKYFPVIVNFPAGVHWSLMQVEYATDIVFHDRETLAPIYEELVRTLAHSVKPDNLSMFLGRRLDAHFEGELGSQFSTRIEGHCIRHHMGKNGIKMYDKLGCILRIETYSNDVSSFKHHRRVEHRNGTWEYKMSPMRKSIYSLSDLAEIMYACNRRYLQFLSAVDDPTNGIRKVNKISLPVRDNGRSYRGFNLFLDEDESVLLAISQTDKFTFGFRNRDLQRLYPGKSLWKISHIIKRLRTHGIIKKATNSFKYFLTSFGKQVVATALKLKQMFVIPYLRGHLKFS